MSLQTSVKRALTEADQLKSDKQLNQSIKDYEIRNALQFAIIEELKRRTIEDLKKSDIKFTIIKNTLYETITDIIANGTEEKYYFYKMQDIYDKELAKIEKQEKQKQKEQEQETTKIDIIEETKRERIEYIIFNILKVLGIIIAIPFLLLGFIIIEVLKNTK